jgi:hypothetical protein
MRAMGIRDKPTAPASPWQNGCAERLIGSIRRECVDHFIVLGEAHLRHILRTYAHYYNDISLSSRSADRICQFTRDPRRVSSPLCPDLGFRYAQVMDLIRGGDQFKVDGAISGKESTVGIYYLDARHPYLATNTDGVPDDNLLALPQHAPA